MKFSIHKKLIWMYLALSMACQTVLDDDYRLSSRKIVVNSLFAADSTWRVYLTWTKPVSDFSGHYSFESVGPAASVMIFDEGHDLVEELTFSLGYNNFIGETKPAIGRNYSIEILYPEENKIRANSVVPPVVPIISLEADSVSYSSDGTVFVDLQFEDPREIKNYYQIKVLKRINSAIGDESIPFVPLDPSIDNDYSTEKTLFIEDLHFDGRLYNLKLKLFKSGYAQIKAPVRIVLQSVSEEYYLYFTSRNLQVNSQGDPFAQPAQIYSNVENGIGIFAGSSYSEVTISK